MHQKCSSISSLNGFKVLLILLFACSTYAQSLLTDDELKEVISETLASPNKYCGKRLNDAMRYYCTPQMKAFINKDHTKIGKPSKKSLDSLPDSDFEPFNLDQLAAEMYHDDSPRSRYDDAYNEVPFMFPSQGKQRRPRGIIDECCKRACYMTELIRFCPQKG